MEFTQKDLAELVGYSVRRLQQIDKELVGESKLFILKQAGGYDGRLFVENWVKYQIKKAMPKERLLDLDQVRARHELLKMEKTGLEIMVRKGELVELAEVKRLWAEIIMPFRNGLMHIGATIAPRVVNEGEIMKIKSMIDKEIKEKIEGIVEFEIEKLNVLEGNEELVAELDELDISEEE